jgi:hypothetical protein
LQQDLLAAAGGNLTNYSGAVYDPATVSALVSSEPLNLASQRIQGTDALINYKHQIAKGELGLFLNGSYLQISQKLTSASPAVELAGLSFNPPRFRARAGTTWLASWWQATAVVNYLGGEINTYSSPQTRVASWTTTDVQLTVLSPNVGAWRGIRASLSVQNVFDKDPPYLSFNTYSTGFNYDSLNVTPLGRYATIQVSKEW